MSQTMVAVPTTKPLQSDRSKKAASLKRLARTLSSIAAPMVLQLLKEFTGKVARKPIAKIPSSDVALTVLQLLKETTTKDAHLQRRQQHQQPRLSQRRLRNLRNQLNLVKQRQRPSPNSPVASLRSTVAAKITKQLQLDRTSQVVHHASTRSLDAVLITRLQLTVHFERVVACCRRSDAAQIISTKLVPRAWKAADANILRMVAVPMAKHQLKVTRTMGAVASTRQMAAVLMKLRLLPVKSILDVPAIHINSDAVRMELQLRQALIIKAAIARIQSSSVALITSHQLRDLTLRDALVQQANTAAALMESTKRKARALKVVKIKFLSHHRKPVVSSETWDLVATTIPSNISSILSMAVAVASGTADVEATRIASIQKTSARELALNHPPKTSAICQRFMVRAQVIIRCGITTATETLARSSYMAVALETQTDSRRLRIVRLSVLSTTRVVSITRKVLCIVEHINSLSSAM